jgi:hypothetical protein
VRRLNKALDSAETLIVRLILVGLLVATVLSLAFKQFTTR